MPHISSTSYNPYGLSPTGDYNPLSGIDFSNFLRPLFEARPQFIQQQGRILQELGASTRRSLLQANPEFGALANYFQESFAQPIPQSLQSNFQDQFRQSLAARGFGSAGGTGPAFQEAQFLTQLGENRRMALAPQMQQFGQSILGQTVGAPLQPDFASFGQFTSGIAQSRIAAGLFSSLYGQGNLPGTPGTGGRSFSSIVGSGLAGGRGGISASIGGGGGGTPDFFSRLSNPGTIGGGGGTPDFFSRLGNPGTTGGGAARRYDPAVDRPPDGPGDGPGGMNRLSKEEIYALNMYAPAEYARMMKLHGYS